MREEEQEQIAVVQYLRVAYPKVLFTIAPQGNKLSIGVATKHKRMGYCAGTSDFLVFEARDGYFGLFLEMKRSKAFGNSKISESQIKFMEWAQKEGYKTAVAFGAQEAYKILDEYFSQGKTMKGIYEKNLFGMDRKQYETKKNNFQPCRKKKNVS